MGSSTTQQAQNLLSISAPSASETSLRDKEVDLVITLVFQPEKRGFNSSAVIDARRPFEWIKTTRRSPSRRLS